MRRFARLFKDLDASTATGDKVAALVRYFGQAVGIVHHHELVERTRRLHVGQHETGLQSLCQQAERMVHGVQRQRRAIDGEQNFHQISPVSRHHHRANRPLTP